VIETTAESRQGLNLYCYVKNDPISNADVNGLQCGSWWNDWAVPEHLAPGINFSGPCEHHDACYSTCSQAKKDCDDQFYNDMMTVCNAMKGWPRTLYYADCVRYAGIYHAAVQKYGQSAYDSAQKSACKKK